MFASGENDYAINNVACRLLDVQELLSDTGLGREHHTIVGQGRLDAVLNARPEERRAFIEEAAGILKHRRRKERAVRKLAQMDSHVERLTDVVRELRRTLRPLERQAEAAAKHAELQARLREVRIVRALREFDALKVRWEAEAAAGEHAAARLAQLEETVAAARRRGGRGARARRPRAGGTDGHRDPLSVGEPRRALPRGLGERIAERRRGLSEAAEEPVAGRDPAELRARAATERDELTALEHRRAAAAAALAAATAARRDAEHARRAYEQAAAAEARRRAAARERLLRWEGEVSALRSSLAQAAGEEGRLAAQVSGVTARRDELHADRTAVQAEIQRVDRAAGTLAEQLDAAEAVVARRQAAADAAALRERELERRRASLEARADALHAASREATEGAAALVAAAATGEVGGVVGPLADHVRVADGMAKAVAAALGPLGDALVVAAPEAAVAAIGFVRSRESGRVLLLVSDPSPGATETSADLSDLGARPLVEALDADAGVVAALTAALAGVYVVADLDVAATLAPRFPGLAFVTRAGEVAGPRGWAGGSAASPSAVLSRAAAEQAEAELAVVADELLRAHRQVADADRDLVAARRELDAATAQMQESDSLLTAAAERLHRLGKELATSAGELDLLTGQQADLRRELAAQRERLALLEGRGVEPIGPDADGPDLEAERLDDRLVDAREAEVQARLDASAVDQQADEVARRAAGLEREADEVERRLAEREARRRARLAAVARCEQLATVTGAAMTRAEASLAAALAERDRVEEARSAQQRRLGVVRAELRDREAALADVREQGHREALARQELRHAVDAVAARLRDDFGLEPDVALAAARAAGGEEAPLGGGPDRDAVLAEDEERLLRKIGLLGSVNPLALEEFHQLEERHAFLTGQLADLRASKQDLLTVVAAVDDRIREIFAAAFTDVAAQFERIFPLLFPGGEGRLVLTDADDLLTAGVDVEARPPGKRVKRLSLLSGGERSLTALAVLFAIFAARPSPFYVLDEVEAALDDINLQRLLDVLDEFRGASQLIVITHQKRTMEVADALYGVSMRGDGVSTVVSQRLREAVPAPR